MARCAEEGCRAGETCRLIEDPEARLEPDCRLLRYVEKVPIADTTHDITGVGCSDEPDLAN